MRIDKRQEMITIVNKDLYINRNNLRYVGEKTVCH